MLLVKTKIGIILMDSRFDVKKSLDVAILLIVEKKEWNLLVIFFKFYIFVL